MSNKSIPAPAKKGTQAKDAESKTAKETAQAKAPETPAAPPAQEPAKEPTAPKAPGKIAQILEHHKAGKTNKEIAQLHLDGDPDKEKFHPTTISIQVTKYQKSLPGYDPSAKQAERDAKKKEQAEAKAKEIAEKKAAKEKEKADAKAKKEADAKAAKEAAAAAKAAATPAANTDAK